VDMEILKILYENGRESLVDIGKKVGLTHPSVRERLNRLTRDGVVRIQANINLGKLDYVVGFVTFEVTDPNALTEFTRQLSRCPRVLLIGFTSGNFNLALMVVAKDIDMLRAFIEKNIRSHSFARNISVGIGKIVHPQYMPIQLRTPKECMEMCQQCVFREKLGICPGCMSMI